jgi:hypothetical protein
MLTLSQRMRLRMIVRETILRRSEDILTTAMPYGLASELVELRSIYDEIDQLPVLEDVCAPPPASLVEVLQPDPQPGSESSPAPGGGALESSDCDIQF